jgi:PBP1b-binding outer membrane lipoprotein LpoB
MKKYICILAGAALLAACEQKTETVAPATNPPAEKTESNTTIINPSPAEKTEKTETNVNVNTSPSPSP